MTEPILQVRFFKTETGHEPVREWLLSLRQDDRTNIGADIKTVQFGWPLGMPLVRKLEPGLWEVRSHISNGIARVIFTVEALTLVLLHGFIKKSQKTEASDLIVSRQRYRQLLQENDNLGSDFDDFLRSEGNLEAAEHIASKRVLAFQIREALTSDAISVSELARRMNTSRSSINRLLDPDNPSVTLETMERVATAIGRRLVVQLLPA